MVWCIDHGVSITRANVKLEYEYDGVVYHYHPDFLVRKSQLIEIKGFADAKAKAKAQRYPEIEIITRGTIEPYIEYVQKKIGQKDLTVLYERG